MKRQLRRGFTLIELLVVITIIAILSGVLFANMSSAAKRGRDVERQANVRNLQNAIEAYKHRNGRYPVQGCTDPSGDGVGFADEKTCPDYITGLAPDFINMLPRDKVRGSNQGYAYVTNANGTVYKVMAMNTVESETVTYTHPFKSCAIIPDNLGRYQYTLVNEINIGGWCANVTDTSGTNLGDLDRCKTGADGGFRFDKSYGAWGGFADTGNGTSLAVKYTTDIICK